MRQRLLFCALALVLFVPSAFARRRAVTPGAPEHCVTGPIARFTAPTSMARDATHLYWPGGFFGGIVRVPLRGGAEERIAELDDWTVQTMHVDDTTVYLGALPNGGTIQPGAILAVPKTGGVVSVIASGVALPYDIETDATHVYWVSVGTPTSSPITDGKIERMRKDGSGRETLVSGGGTFDLALDGDRLWYGETGLAGDERIGLYTIPKSGGARTTIRNDVAVGHLTLLGDSVVVEGATETLDLGILVIAKDGSSVRAIAEESDISGPQRVLGGRVFYVTVTFRRSNALWSVPLDGSAAPVMVRDDLGFLDEIETDGCALIVSTNDGKILRVAP